MKMSWRKFFYILLGLGVLVILVALYILHLIRTVPEAYDKELRRPDSIHVEPVQELLDAGVDPSEMMSDARLEDINERALAQNFETWPVFMQMVS